MAAPPMCAHWSFVWARSSASMSIAARFAISSIVAAVGGAASFPSSSDPAAFLAANFSSRPHPRVSGEPGWRGLRPKTPSPLDCVLASSCVYSSSNSSQSTYFCLLQPLPKAFLELQVLGRHLINIGFVVFRRSSSSPLRNVGTKAMRPFSTQSHRPAAAARCRVFRTKDRLSAGSSAAACWAIASLEQGKKPCLQVWLHSSRLKHRGSSRSFQHRMRARCPLCAWVGHWWSVMWHSVQWSHSGSSQPLRPPTVSSPVSRPGHKFSRSEPPSCTLPSTTIRCTGGIGSTTGRLSWHKLVKAPRLSGRASCGYHIASAIFPNPWYCLTSLPSISSFCPSPASPSSISSSTSSSIRESSGPLRRLVPPAAY